MSLERARALVRAARRVGVLTGAGISRESGVPTFRDADGLWKNFRPEDVATPEAFARDPRRVWEWYDSRRRIIARAQPNAAHRALAALQGRSEVLLITQNVDGLHQAAGSRRVVEFHGNLWRTRCTRCGDLREDRRVPLDPLPPRCTRCDGLLRPDVVWFGELIPMEACEAAGEAASRSDVFLVIGTSGTVEPAASIARSALARGIPVIEINAEQTPWSPLYTISLIGRAGEIVPSVVDAGA
jgi:NAD-dependent deacetylase